MMFDRNLILLMLPFLLSVSHNAAHLPDSVPIKFEHANEVEYPIYSRYADEESPSSHSRYYGLVEDKRSHFDPIMFRKRSHFDPIMFRKRSHFDPIMFRKRSHFDPIMFRKRYHLDSNKFNQRPWAYEFELRKPTDQNA
ncbi:hypothetical protein PHET_01667 [Paragonimus heterotremus]|uniref:Uncharacterized protein n=1 Tax=Paragonimus heterotremus TaxID=100268 RepID=A0A8J4TRD8_9TREM|nr:hypothetical protein PHET_01667 [Paragonimus heterotremus]